MIDAAALRQGTRIRLRSASHVVELRADTGTITRADDWGDYYVVRLDRPALYFHRDGRIEELTEICELSDNMEVLGQEP